MLKVYEKVILDNYSNFRGRARRKDFFLFFVANFIISLIIDFISGYIAQTYIGKIYGLAVLVPSIAIVIRRLQDVDKEWWYIFIPFYNIYLLCLEGTKGSNRFGKDSKGKLEDINEVGKDLD